MIVAALLGLSALALLFAVGTAGGFPIPACGWAWSDAVRDSCLHDRLQRADVTANEALTFASAIHDPMVRGASVTGWVRSHRKDVALNDVFALCGLLNAEEEATCVRRASAQHLQ